MRDGLQPRRPASQEERKIVTVLFCDLVGFTSQSDRTDPEDVLATLRPYQTRLRTETERFGGTVEKFIGDAVMAVFGAPVAHEDDPERAVRAALRILEAIPELNQAHSGFDLQVRIGVNTGEAVVVLDARPEQGEGMVAGDVVNTASRLQAVAPVGGIVVGEITYRTTHHLIDYEALEPVAVKGKAEPVRIWRAVSARGRYGLEMERPATPFVGREDDLALLTRAYRRMLRDSSIQLVTIAGEPGVGKSRLVQEFFRFVGEQPELVTWREGRCLPYGEGITFWALGEVIKAQGGILESDPPDVVAQKLDQAVGAVATETAEREWIKAKLAPLVGASLADGEASGDRSESFTAWRRFLEGLASARALVMVIEDLHWADQAMLGFIDHLVEFSTGVPILVLCTARAELYEREPGRAGGKRNSTTISLSPLTDQETARLLADLLAQAVLPAEVQEPLLEQVGGNPLYAEEFVRMLTDRGLVEPGNRILTLSGMAEAELPDTVQAIIAARLDTLPADRKALLQDASVVGKVFWDGALSFMGRVERQEVARGLHELVRKELVRPARKSSMADQVEYSFWHALVRDVAYAGIPRAPREKKHRAAAAWIEQVAGSRLADRAEILAYHYGQAMELLAAAGATDEARNLEDPTRQFLLMAGDHALQLDVAKALSYYRKALEVVPVDHRDRPSVLAKCGEAAWRRGNLAQAEQYLEAAVVPLKAQDRLVEAAEAMVKLSDVLRDRGQPDRVETLLAEAVRLLEAHPPGPGLARGYLAMARHALMSGRPAECLEWSAKGLALSRKFDMHSETARLLQFTGQGRCELGDLGGLEDLREALRMCLDHRLDSFVTALGYNNLGEMLSRIESPARGIEVRTEGVQFAESRGMTWMAMGMRSANALYLVELGQWEEALRITDEALQGEGSAEDPNEQGWGRWNKARVSYFRGEIMEARSLKERFLPLARQLKEPQVLAPALVVAALIEHSVGNVSAALRLVDEYINASRGKATMRFIFQAFTDALRVLIAGGDMAKAERLLEEEEGRDLGPRQQYSLLTGRAMVAEDRGDLDEASRLHLEAAERWAEFGHLVERGRALLGAGRCLVALSRSGEGAARLLEAQEVFTSLGARPLLAETDALLEAATRLSS